MFNHARGLWGYTGLAADGEPLSIQSTGMGGPSAAIVCEELIALGARRLLRIGTCGALRDDLELGRAAGGARGAAGRRAERRARRRRARGGATPAHGAPGGGRRPPVTVVSTDLFYDDRARARGGLAAPTGGRGGGDGDGHPPAAGRAARRSRRPRCSA